MICLSKCKVNVRFNQNTAVFYLYPVFETNIKSSFPTLLVIPFPVCSVRYFCYFSKCKMLLLKMKQKLRVILILNRNDFK